MPGLRLHFGLHMQFGMHDLGVESHLHSWRRSSLLLKTTHTAVLHYACTARK